MLPSVNVDVLAKSYRLIIRIGVETWLILPLNFRVTNITLYVNLENPDEMLAQRSPDHNNS